jgi:hypothetical protein
LFIPSRASALHESAHAVVGALKGITVERVSIIPDKEDGSLGHVRFGATDSSLAQARIVATLAGTLGEQLDVPAGFLPDDFGWSDRAQACEAALRLALSRDGGHGSADEILERAAWEAEQLVDEHRETIERLADALMEHHILDGEAIRRLVANVPEWFIGTVEQWTGGDPGTRTSCDPAARHRGAYRPNARDWTWVPDRAVGGKKKHIDGSTFVAPGYFVSNRAFTVTVGKHTYNVGKDERVLDLDHPLVRGLRTESRRSRDSRMASRIEQRLLSNATKR